MGTLPIHLGLDRAHIATHRGSLKDLIYLESLDAESEERPIIAGLYRVCVGQGQGRPGRQQLSIWLAAICKVCTSFSLTVSWGIGLPTGRR